MLFLRLRTEKFVLLKMDGQSGMLFRTLGFRFKLCNYLAFQWPVTPQKVFKCMFLLNEILHKTTTLFSRRVCMILWSTCDIVRIPCFNKLPRGEESTNACRWICYHAAWCALNNQRWLTDERNAVAKSREAHFTKISCHVWQPVYHVISAHVTWSSHSDVASVGVVTDHLLYP